jgi:hypothetical protein
MTINTKKWKQIGVATRDESIGKVFIVITRNTRRCLVCDQLFTREESFEHSQLTCYPAVKGA